MSWWSVAQSMPQNTLVSLGGCWWCGGRRRAGLRVFLMAGLRGPSSDQSFAIPAVARGLGQLRNWSVRRAVRGVPWRRLGPREPTMPLFVCEWGWRGRPTRDEGMSAGRPRHPRSAALGGQARGAGSVLRGQASGAATDDHMPTRPRRRTITARRLTAPLGTNPPVHGGPHHLNWPRPLPQPTSARTPAAVPCSRPPLPARSDPACHHPDLRQHSQVHQDGPIRPRFDPVRPCHSTDQS